MTRRGCGIDAVVLAGAALLGGCASQPPMYQWGAFPKYQYDVLRGDGASPVDQIRLMEEHAQKARGTNAALPPGFRAHLGMLYLDAGDVQRAQELWTAEKTAFPESAPYIDRLLGRLATPAAGGKGNPA